MTLLVNIDVPDLQSAVTFYTQAFGLTVSRRFGAQGLELSGWPVPVYLLQKMAGSAAAGTAHRSYERHWTPVHLDVVVSDIEAAVSQAVREGAIVEQEIRAGVWGKLAVLADPFGHGFCLVQFLNRGYDEIATP